MFTDQRPGESLYGAGEPFIPLVEEALGVEDVSPDRREAVYEQVIPIAEGICTEADVRDMSRALPERIVCTPEVPYCRQGGNEYSLRLVLSNRRLANADFLPLPTAEIELVETDGEGQKTKRTIAAMSHSILAAGYADYRNRYDQPADLEGFVAIVEYIRTYLADHPSD